MLRKVLYLFAICARGLEEAVETALCE
jgi:hypothetical protein